MSEGWNLDCRNARMLECQNARMLGNHNAGKCQNTEGLNVGIPVYVWYTFLVSCQYMFPGQCVYGMILKSQYGDVNMGTEAEQHEPLIA